MLESLLLTFVIDVYEERYVASLDIPGAYLHAKMKKFVLLKIDGEFVDIICQMDPGFAPHIRYENGKKVLYIQLLKALYGCIESALLWYNLFSTTLKDLGFEINPYDKCIANMKINGKQCTIAWYVDDNKIFHVDSKVVTKI